MWQDWLESVIFAGVAGIFLGLLWAVLIGCSWLLIAKFLRRSGQDSVWEHVNHDRHGKAYKG